MQSASAQEGSSDSTQTKIFPRNLTARAQFQVVGNPIVTRAEDAVANCFPGLELDIRNLDRRFFPGLVFNFVEPAGDSKRGTQYGAKLAYIDVLEDPDLRLDLEETQYRLYEVMEITPKYAKELYAELAATGKNPVTGKYTAATSLATGNWYLDWIEQGGKKISTRSGKDDLTGLTVWRLIRGLEPGLVSIGLKRRDKPYAKSALVLHGWRRLYTDPRTGVISGAYQPGELMQGLCSPWQHDFRDCYCHYWASNRSDLVFGDLYPGEPVLPDGEAVDSSLNLRLDWMRADRSRELAVEAFGIVEKNRPYQFDHFQINREWQNLSIVLNGREIDSVHLSEPDDAANPYDTPEKLAEQLRDFLAPLELTFVFEYLFARFSLRNPAEVRNEPVRDALTLAREYLLLIAISEMQHLRWANEILWELRKAGKIKDYKPVIKLADLVPQESGGPLPDGSRTDKKVVEEYIKARRKIRFHPTDEVATARAVLEFKNDYPDRPDDYPDDPPQEVIDKFKATFDKFKRMRQNAAPNEWPPPEALKQFKEKSPDADPKEWRMPRLCRLTRKVQQDFINIERPNAFVDRTYARVAATLGQPGEYPTHLVGLAKRILHDGMQHESRFNAIKAALEPFKDNEGQYLRPMDQIGDTAAAIAYRDRIIKALEDAYTAAAGNDIGKSNEQIVGARTAMRDLLQIGEDLSKANVRIPFFDRWPKR